MMPSMAAILILFLSTLSLRRATHLLISNDTSTKNFYPRSPCGERLDQIQPRRFHYHFYPRSPCGERRLISQTIFIWVDNFYPRSPCGERLGQCLAHCITNSISIHALLAESDCGMFTGASRISEISIHALLAESDKCTP